MAKRHFEKYYEEICAQYHEMNNDLKEMEAQVQEGMASPEFLNNLKTMIAPIYNNWRTVNYIKFLLDMPNKDKKQAGYEARNKKFLQSCKTADEIKYENNSVLKQLKETSID